MPDTRQTANRVCLVGAGPGGLIVARQLRDAGIPFDHYEKHSDVGGIWDAENPGSPIYNSAHFVSSKTLSGFRGHPMPEHYPDYPSWSQIRDYVREFAKAENLYENITFNALVEKADLVPDGSWQVTVNGTTLPYRALIAVPGQTWHPHIPTLPGQETYTGEILHSSTYFEPSIFRGKRVLIVGAGNSGVDIACDAATNADVTFFSVRRGYRYVPKHVFGVPFDVFLYGGNKAPEWVSVPADPNTFIDGLVGDLTQLGLPQPDHNVLETHPIVNDQVIHHLRHGDIIAKPDIERLDGDTVIFRDGTREHVDLILLATGYEHRATFLDESLLHGEDGHQDLYLNFFSRKSDSLYVLGFIALAGAAYERYDEMAQLVAMDLTLQGADKEEFSEQKRTHRPDLRGGMNYVASRRNEDYVENITYQVELAKIRQRFGVPDLEFSIPAASVDAPVAESALA